MSSTALEWVVIAVEHWLIPQDNEGAPPVSLAAEQSTSGTALVWVCSMLRQFGYDNYDVFFKDRLHVDICSFILQNCMFKGRWFRAGRPMGQFDEFCLQIAKLDIPGLEVNFDTGPLGIALLDWASNKWFRV